MATEVFTPTEPMKPPRMMTGPVAWLRENLFSSWLSTLATLVAVFVIYKLMLGILNWAVFDAVWSGSDGKACGGDKTGACWPFVAAKLGQFVYGRYPEDERWRVNLTYVLALAGLLPLLVPAGASRRMLALVWAGIVAIGLGFSYIVRVHEFGMTDALTLSALISVPVVASALIALVMLVQASPRLTSWFMLYFFVIFPPLAFILLCGWDAIGLKEVATEFWGGLLITLVVATVGIVASFPIGIVLALGRRSNMPIVKWTCIIFIEFVRGVPLITVLFMASVMLPLFLPAGMNFNKLVRALVGVSLFSGAYMAETIRGGLQAIPRGQSEAAGALGLNYWQTMGLIVLPQALKLVIPGIVNSFIGLFKDTSLVLIIGLFDVLGIVQANMSDQKWFSPNTAMTGYVFAGVLFWVFCFGMSRYSQYMERRLNTGHR